MLKGFNVPVTVYLSTKHCKLKQYNDKNALVI